MDGGSVSALGVIRNPASSANRRARQLTLPTGVPLIAPPAPAAIGEAVRSLLARGVRRIAVDGGDGTVRLAIDAILAAGAAQDVSIVLLRRGNTNLFCREIGAWTQGLPGERSGHIVARRLLRVATGERCWHGLIFGLGAYEQATRLATARPALLGSAGVAVSLGHGLLQAVSEGAEGAWRRGIPLALAIDGTAAPAGRRLLFAATVAEGRLPLGLDPFGREGHGALRWLDIEAPGRHLASAVLPVLTGQKRPWLADAGYRVGRANTIALEGTDSMVIDGDIVELSAGTLNIGLSHPLRFLVPEAKCERGARDASERPAP